MPLTLLTSVLVGYGLSSYAQQAVLGVLILAIVATCARKPPMRYQV
jgi:ribose/xylose/arabinose/galactoside ABC-type transport system permease subunit